MGDKFTGHIFMFGGSISIRNCAACDGQLLSVNQNPALFSLLGARYGGNGQTTFGLPDLRGRAPVGYAPSADPGWAPTPVGLGESGGAEGVALTEAQMPQHGHAQLATTAVGAGRAPRGVPASTIGAVPIYGPAQSTIQIDSATQVAGQGVPHTNMQPYQAVNFQIVLAGIFPSRP